MLHPPRRLFIGLIPERSVQLQIQRHCRDWTWPEQARPTRFGRYHIALHDLGDVGLGPEQTLRKALRQLPMQAMELQLGEPQLWQHGIAVLKLGEHQGLRALHKRIGEVLPTAGLKPDGAEFDAHVTLARDAMGASPPREHPFIRWHVREFVLVWSRQPPEVKPAQYDILERFGVNDRSVFQAASGQSGEQFPLFG
jgi:2'-5' RNA ligase